MIRLSAIVLSAVELGAGFGTASATVVSTTAQSIIVEMHVEVDEQPDSVVAHLSLPGEDQITVPLLPRDDGTYGVTTEVRPADYVVVFEAIGGPGAGQSDPVPLSELGVDLGPDLSTETTEAEGQSPETRRWLWLGVALAAASLSALAFWVLGGRDRGDEGAEGDESAADEEAPAS
ncbi:MAG: hypothetical protein ACRDZM_15610 [Acidimicrobiia bacterium]